MIQANEKNMKKIAVIIKHPYRDYDWRVDIIEVDETWTHEDIMAQLQYEMLGPFEVVGLTQRISLDRKFPYLKRLEKRTTDNEQEKS